MYNPECNSKSTYHEPFTIHEDNKILYEGCESCKEKIEIRKTPSGALMDDDLYVKFHAKDLLQSSEKDFDRVYGHGSAKRNQDNRKNLIERKLAKYHIEQELLDVKDFYKTGRKFL